MKLIRKKTIVLAGAMILTMAMSTSAYAGTETGDVVKAVKVIPAQAMTKIELSKADYVSADKLIPIEGEFVEAFKAVVNILPDSIELTSIEKIEK